ncbi:type II secretion system F family protein [Candidatus Nomurabacteria bacterium]|nr:type II secretion system F family protein [Candidatus Nomurabacteria bacterium]MCB9820377.1 type II secretion system F family protein [Candidatus Nomurabacteria bacterium]
MFFKVKAINQNRERVDEVREAKSRQELLETLKSEGFHPLEVVEVKEKKALSLFSSVKTSEKMLFAKNLSNMLKAGLTLSRALNVFEKQTKNKEFKKIIASMISDIDKGASFSESMEKHKKVFSVIFVSMVRAGEESGQLSKTLLEIGQTLEKSYLLTKKVKGAMTYPSIIVAAMGLIGVLMMIFVVPSLTSTFEGLGIELPPTTRFVIGISSLFINHPAVIFLGFAAFLGGIVYMVKNPKLKKYIQFIVLRLPVVKNIVKEMNAARTARTMASLLAAGVPVTRALEITHDVVQNVYFQRIIDKAREDVIKGIPISKIFKEHTEVYPVMLGEMMEVGEETGELSNMLDEIAIFYEGEVEQKTKDLSTIIEPVLMIFIGGAVGFFAISMLTPMYSILDTVG